MKVLLSERFQHDARSLDEEQRQAVFEVILSLPRAMGDAHTHAGLGIRKLHRSGIWETRAGLGVRLVFGLQPGMLSLVRVDCHEDVRRFLREL